MLSKGPREARVLKTGSSRVCRRGLQHVHMMYSVVSRASSGAANCNKYMCCSRRGWLTVRMGLAPELQ